MGLGHHEPLLRTLRIGGAITGVICLAAGCSLAIFRLVQGWVYNQIENDPYRR